MPKSQKTIHIDREIIAEIEAIAFKGDRTFSYAANKLLREGIEARSMKAASKTTEAATP